MGPLSLSLLRCRSRDVDVVCLWAGTANACVCVFVCARVCVCVHTQRATCCQFNCFVQLQKSNWSPSRERESREPVREQIYFTVCVRVCVSVCAVSISHWDLKIGMRRVHDSTLVLYVWVCVCAQKRERTQESGWTHTHSLTQHLCLTIPPSICKSRLRLGEFQNNNKRGDGETRTIITRER